MQYTRGYVTFNIGYEDLKMVAHEFALDGCGFGLIRKNGYAGFIVSGAIGNEFTSGEVIEYLNVVVGNDVEIINHDVSITGEDNMSHIKDGKLTGNFISIKVYTSDDISTLDKLARTLGKTAEAGDVMLRESGRNEYLDQNIHSIDIITDKDPKSLEDPIQKLLEGYSARFTYYEIGK